MLSIENAASLVTLIVANADSPLIANAIVADALREAFERGYTLGYGDGCKGAPIRPARKDD